MGRNTEKIFPTKTGGLSKYKHLGVAGSPAHVEAAMLRSRRTQLEFDIFLHRTQVISLKAA